jgi:ATP-dependent helicase HepA
MIRLNKLHRKMVVKGIVADDAVEILDLQWTAADQLTVVCQDSQKRLHKITLNPSHEDYLECINVSLLPWELLPQTPNEEDMKTLTKTDKKRLNQSFSRAGFSFYWDKEGGFSDWTHGKMTYRVFHTSSQQSLIALLEAESVETNQHETEFEPDITPATEDGNPIEASLETVDSRSPPTPNSTPYLPARHPLTSGMYVRIPFDLEELEGEYRDYRIGQITSVNHVANLAQIRLQTHSPGQPVAQEMVERDMTHIHRCHILPQTSFTHVDTQQTGEVLLPCQENWEERHLCDYYVQLEGKIQRLSEDKLLVASHRQSPKPIDQLKRYELHHPRWKFERDQLIESYAQLHAATFGLEDLVGSRIMLLPHQAEVVATVLSDETCRYILADEVGLGKTIEACVILKGLCRRHSNLKTLIIVPASLVEQWHYELNSKFWLDFVRGDQIEQFHLPDGSPGVIVSTEKLSTDRELALWLSIQTWGLLVVDEAHHLHKRPALYERVYQLSSDAERTLILSATPIQRRTDEYLALLKLMHPDRYSVLSRAQFAHILQAQQTLRETIAYLAQALSLAEFDLDEFLEEMEIITGRLAGDQLLAQLVAKAAKQPNRHSQLAAAREAIGYVSENYRIESRVIRNRRVNLNIELPQRDINTDFSYLPDNTEIELLNELYDYMDYMLLQLNGEQHRALALEYSRILLHKAFSSPHSLEALLKERQQLLQSPSTQRGSLSTQTLLTPATPRQEAQRIRGLVTHIPVVAGEDKKLGQLRWLCDNWREQTDNLLESLSIGMAIPPKDHRLIQVLRAIQGQLRSYPASKIVIFSAWTETLVALLPHLTRLIRPFRGRVAQFHNEIPSDELQTQVDYFQSKEDYHVLLCDELGGEGRNFQIADIIIHLDIPWTPAQIEQRIGRVDRLGRTGKVVSIVPYAQEQVEQDLFRIWEEGFQLFTHSMSGLEIALESVLNDLLSALKHGSRDSLIDLLPEMLIKAGELREAVEEERYFEENAINHRRRDEFQQLSDQYRDGSQLGRSFTRWATMAGLENTFNPKSGIVTFLPKRFNYKSMANAKFFTPPNMEEALLRSRRTHNLVIKGTFNRDVAVQREDLVFFAPGNDPWTDAIVGNALEADRGRSCAILRKTELITTPWQGIELFYQLQVNPRPLYEAGYSPIHLFQAQGYLFIPVYRIVISIDGEVVSNAHPAWQAINAHSFSRSNIDTHLGKRGTPRMLDLLKDAFPTDVWEDVLENIVVAANKKLEEEFEFTEDVAQEAAEEFERKHLGLRAAQHWFQQSYGQTKSASGLDINTYEEIAEALIEGIRHPLIQLESACFWMLHPLNP